MTDAQNTRDQNTRQGVTLIVCVLLFVFVALPLMARIGWIR